MVNQIIELLRNYVIMALIAGLIAGYIASALSGKNSIGIIAGILIILTVLMVPLVLWSNKAIQRRILFSL